MLVKSYWFYYLELENEFLSTRKYVEFNPINYGTYSIEYLKMYQTVCSEIDTIGKEMAQAANPSFNVDEKKNNITKWWYEIEENYKLPTNNEMPKEYRKSCSLIKDKQVKLLGEWELIPWENFDVEMVKSNNKKGETRTYTRLSKNEGKDSKTPSWWSAYNSVKHHRTGRIAEDSEKTN